MDILQDNPKAACGCCVSVVALIVAIAGLAYCAGTVEPIQYGLKYNTFSKNIDNTQVYEGGWYIIGPFNKFIQFPRTQINVDFADFKDSKQKPLVVRSGVSMNMSFSFQYKLIKETLPKLYEQHNIRYEKELILTTAEGVIKEEATRYNMSDYWQKRKEIGDAFCQALNFKLVYANCTGFQLLSVSSTLVNENSIIKTQVRIQEGFQKQYEQDASNITARMTVDTSEAQRQITVFQGEAQADSTYITNQATGNSTRISIDAQAQAYQIASQLTNQTATDTLMDYIYYTNLIGTKNSTILVGIDKAVVRVAGKGY